MAKFIDWYSVELDSFLRGRIADENRFEAVKEVSNHLSEHVDELVSKGMNETDAQKAALAAFGSPRDASLNLLNQGPRSKVGGYLTALAAVSIFLLIVVGVLFTQMYMLHLQPPRLLESPFRYWSTGSGLLVASIIFGLAGAFYSRKVPVKKYFMAFGMGVLVSAGYLLAGPERQFADVPRERFASSLDKWKAINEDTKKLARLDQSIRDQFDERYSNDTNEIVPIDKSKAIAKIKSVGPEMLTVNPKFVTLTGTATSGYLVPAQNNGSDDFYLSAGRYRSGFSFGEQYGLYTDDFPTSRMFMRYVKSEDEAFSGWKVSRYRYSSYGTDFRSVAVMQHDYINSAEQINRQSRAELAGTILAGVGGGTLVWVGIMLLASWIVTKIPSLAIRSNFKKVVA